MSAAKHSARHERGASLVEFAIVLPLFLVLIGGMVDFGRAFFTEVMLTNAAREGARSAMYSATAANTTSRAQTAGGSTSLNVTITNPCPATPSATPTSVTVTVQDPNFQWILIKPAMALLGASLADPNLSGKATMQCGG